MKFEKDDISDNMRQAALFAIAPEAVVDNKLAGRRDLDNYAKVRCMIDDMIRDKRSEESHQIEWRRQSTAAERRPPSVDQPKLREMTLDFAEEASLLRPAVAAAQGSRKGQRKTKQGERQRQRQEWTKSKRQGTMPHRLGTLRGCAPVKNELTTWSRTRPMEKTPMKTEEDDETLQLGYLGSESCLKSYPPGLSDAFSEAGWTVVTRNVSALLSVARFSDTVGR